MSDILFEAGRLRSPWRGEVGSDRDESREEMARKAFIGLAAVFSVMAMAGCSGSTKAGGHDALNASVVLQGSGVWSPAANAPTTPDGSFQDGDKCVPDDSYKVTVSNQDGRVLAQQTMDARLADTPSGTYSSAQQGCVVPLDFGQVGTASQYGFSVDGSAPVFFSKSRVQADNYDVTVTYGL